MKIIHGDCFEVLKSHPENSVDSVVTDPPYGLSFMGKKWDYQVPEVELWKEVLRVLKPGGHALVACGTRTQHRMAVNLEDAGFEIRDIVAWIYGSGFPKSLNIGKAIDKLQGNEREVVGKGTGTSLSHANRVHLEQGYRPYVNGVPNQNAEFNITKGNSEWEGWGTALKPAMELWTLCRKPLSENTVAENVLKWGTGGINIDGSRVGFNENSEQFGKSNSEYDKTGGFGFYDGAERQIRSVPPTTGRFPANIIHDGSEEVVREFPQSNGQQGDLIGHNKEIESPNGIYGKFAPRYDALKRNDSGSAARFFYCAKASQSERDAGLKDAGSYKFRTDGSLDGNKTAQRKNNHPTVKPVALMEYLIKLITPPRGIVLDPFMGSGSTGVAAKKLGFDFIGIEREKDYVNIATARTEHETPAPKQLSLL